MPELPEVETVACILRTCIVGQRLDALLVDQNTDQQEQLSTAVGSVLKSIERTGKNLFFVWGNDSMWRLHLGMSGRMLIKKSTDIVEKHTHLRMVFGDHQVHYVDPRRFGFVVPWHPSDGALPPDPLDPQFSVEQFRRQIAASRRDLKALLMDQRVAPGVGNIYASEILFSAKLHPLRAGTSLSFFEIMTLHRSMFIVLFRAVEQGGTSLTDFGYRNPWGDKGRYQASLWVYGREGLPCRVCDGFVSKIRQHQRTTYFCASCQRDADG